MLAIEGYHSVPVIQQRDMSPYNKPVENLKGFPGFKLDAVSERIDLSRALIRHPALTYFIRITEKAMPRSLSPESIALIEKDREPRNGDLVLVFFEGEFLFRRIQIKNVYPLFVAEDEEVPPIEIEPDMSYSVWGVVVDVI